MFMKLKIALGLQILQKIYILQFFDLNQIIYSSEQLLRISVGQMEILRFLKIIQRIIIFIVITGFVPLSIYVFSARSMNVPSDMQLAYQMLERQIRTGFIVDMRKDCSLSDAISYNSYCFEYCMIDSTCSIVDTNKICLVGQSQYMKFGKKYCAQKAINNQLSIPTSQNISLTQNPNLPPLYSIQSESRPTYYIFNGDQVRNRGKQTCKQITSRLGRDISTVQKLQSQGFLLSLQYLYYTLLPIFLFAIISTIAQTFTRYDFKRMMQISLFNSCIVSVSIIIISIVFDVDSGEFQGTIRWLGQNCLIQSTYSQGVRLSLTQDIGNGLYTGFTIVIAIVGVVQVFLVISLLIIWSIQIRMYKLRKEDISSGYQLQTL